MLLAMSPGCTVLSRHETFESYAKQIPSEMPPRYLPEYIYRVQGMHTKSTGDPLNLVVGYFATLILTRKPILP